MGVAKLGRASGLAIGESSEGPGKVRQKVTLGALSFDADGLGVYAKRDQSPGQPLFVDGEAVLVGGQPAGLRQSAERAN